MAAEWRNNGEPVDGEYIMDLDLEDGSQPQTFKGTTIVEVTNKLANAQLHASRRIAELKRDLTPDPKKPDKKFKPRKLTPEEEFTVANKMRAGQVQEAVDTVVTASLGAPLSEVRTRLQEDEDDRSTAAAIAATEAFVAATPDWYPTEKNKLALWQHLADNNMELTAKNFGIAFDRLNTSGLLERRPETPNEPPATPPEPIAPAAGRPRASFSTGVRNSEVSSVPGSPPRPKQKYTRQEIETMPQSIYKHKLLTEPGFGAAVNAVMGTA